MRTNNNASLNSCEFVKCIHYLNTVHPRGTWTQCGQVGKTAEEKTPRGEIQTRAGVAVGGNKIEYYGDVTALTAEIPTINKMLNAVASKDAEWLTLDIEEFYLGYTQDATSLVTDNSCANRGGNWTVKQKLIALDKR